MVAVLTNRAFERLTLIESIFALTYALDKRVRHELFQDETFRILAENVFDLGRLRLNMMGWRVGLEGYASLLLECHLLILEEFWWEIGLHCWKPGNIEQGSLLRLIFLHYIPHFLSLHFSSRVHLIRRIARKDILILIYFIIHILP